jgi:hypothetical protein
MCHLKISRNTALRGLLAANKDLDSVLAASGHRRRISNINTALASYSITHPPSDQHPRPKMSWATYYHATMYSRVFIPVAVPLVIPLAVIGTETISAPTPLDTIFARARAERAARLVKKATKTLPKLGEETETGDECG